MRAFVFRLDPVLAVRARDLDAAREEYGRSVQAVAAAEAELAQVREESMGLSRELARHRAGSFRRSDHELFWNAISELDLAAKRLEEQLAAARVEAARRHAALVEARSKHETLVRLKTQQREAHADEVRHREETEMDDLANAGYARRLQELTR